MLFNKSRIVFPLAFLFAFLCPMLAATTTINDYSRLNQTRVHDIVEPATYKEVIDLMQDAQAKGITVSVAGARHSQGGHAFYTDGRVLNLKNLNKILAFDPDQKTITVQTGIHWKEVQEFLCKHGFAVKIMQVANIFTVGGALSVNANGMDLHCGPFIESIRSFSVVSRR